MHDLKIAASWEGIFPSNQQNRHFSDIFFLIRDAEILKVFRFAKQHGALICVHAAGDAIIAPANAALIEAGHYENPFRFASLCRGWTIGLPMGKPKNQTI